MLSAGRQACAQVALGRRDPTESDHGTQGMAEMLGGIVAALKGMLMRRLTFQDLCTLIESSARDPAPLDFLTESAHLSWANVTSGKAGSFNEHWRNARLLPLLRAISVQPTYGLQCEALRGILLDEAAKGTWAARVLSLPSEEAGEALQDYPDPSASSNSVEWKRDHVSLELVFSSLNTSVLLKLGSRGFGINPGDFEAWSDLYAEAFAQHTAQAALLGAGYAMPPHKVLGDAPDDDILASTISTLAVMREEIASGRGNVEENAERYRQLVQVTQSLLNANE
jgi:hypothetical protein